MISHKKDQELVEQAFKLLYPEHTELLQNYELSVRYSRRFADYNANAGYRSFLGKKRIAFRLCRNWKDVSSELKMGLFQELFLKLGKKIGLPKQNRENISTLYLDLYNNFIKNLHIAAPKTDIDPTLQVSFQRVNERYFLGVVEIPNLVWGEFTKRKLGSYDFRSDTITMSRVLSKLGETNPEFLDTVMYHEMLHKQNKFRSCNGRTLYHDKRFKQAEQMFEDFENVQKRMNQAVHSARRPAGVRLPFERKEAGMKASPLEFLKSVWRDKL